MIVESTVLRKLDVPGWAVDLASISSVRRDACFERSKSGRSGSTVSMNSRLQFAPTFPLESWRDHHQMDTTAIFPEFPHTLLAPARYNPLEGCSHNETGARRKIRSFL